MRTIGNVCAAEMVKLTCQVGTVCHGPNNGPDTSLDGDAELFLGMINHQNQCFTHIRNSGHTQLCVDLES